MSTMESSIEKFNVLRSESKQRIYPLHEKQRRIEKFLNENEREKRGEESPRVIQ